MKLKKFILSAIALYILFLGAINIYQPSRLNSDGSGSFKLSYYTSDSNLAITKVLGNYPFTKSEAENYFTSANTEVTSAAIYNDKERAMTHVVLEIDFEDINRISEAKGFSDINATWTKSDQGMNFKWIILKNPLQNNTLGDLVYIFHFDGKIVSSDGDIKGDSVTWAINRNYNDYSNDVVLNATIKNKSCGTFGMELPIILLGLILISMRYKRISEVRNISFNSKRSD